MRGWIYAAADMLERKPEDATPIVPVEARKEILLSTPRPYRTLNDEIMLRAEQGGWKYKRIADEHEAQGFPRPIRQTISAYRMRRGWPKREVKSERSREIIPWTIDHTQHETWVYHALLSVIAESLGNPYSDGKQRITRLEKHLILARQRTRCSWVVDYDRNYGWMLAPRRQHPTTGEWIDNEWSRSPLLGDHGEQLAEPVPRPAPRPVSPDGPPMPWYDDRT